MNTAPPFTAPLPVVGMVHLRALPGAPSFAGSMREILDQARADAVALAAGGVDGIMVENFGDIPFFAERVPAETIAAMTRAVDAVVTGVRAVSAVSSAGHAPRVGVNVLRNDARAALAIAAACEVDFIRVNVHTGAMHTDQGPITGRAADTLRLREALPGRPAILADVFVKHATPPAGASIEDAARDLVERGLADGVIVSGSGTGESTPLASLRAVRSAIQGKPIWVGSGAAVETVAELASLADGFIVGSSLKVDGMVNAPVDPDRVDGFMAAVQELREGI